MKRLPMILAALAVAAACARGSNGGGGGGRQDPDDLKREIARLRGELVRAKIEILDLKLKDARRAANFGEEMRLLLADGLDSEYPEVQDYAFKELQNLPPARRKAAIAPILQKDNPTERFKVLAIPFLAAAGDADADQRVLDWAKDPSPDVRRTVAGVLKTNRGDPAFRALVELLQDPQKEVRIAAVDALAVPKTDAAVKHLAALVERAKEEPEILEKVAEAFGVIGSAEAVPILIEKLLKHENKGVCWISVKSLGMIGDPRAIEKLRPLLQSEFTDIREITTRSLGKLKDAESLPAFEAMLTSESEPQLRDAAAEAIRLIGDPKSIDALMKAHETEKEPGPQKTMWRSILRLAEADLGNLDKVATWLVSRGLADEVEEVAAKVAAWAGENGAVRIAAILEKIADFTFSKELWLPSKSHYQRLLKYAPKNWKAYKNLAMCYRKLTDVDNAVKTLKEGADKARADKQEEWWSFQEAIVATVADLNDPFRTLDETWSMLQFAGPPESVTKAHQAALDAVLALVDKGEDAPVANAIKLGKKIILSIAKDLETARTPGRIKVGNAIAGTSVDPASTDANALKAAAAEWRKWYEANK